LNDGNKVTVWLLLGAVKALLLSANNNQKLFCELLILAEHRVIDGCRRRESSATADSSSGELNR